MPDDSTRRPTDAELRILSALWELGPSTVRQVHEALASRSTGGRASGQTTTLKHMQIMLDKGLLSRDSTRRPQIYTPALPQGQTQNQLLRHLLDRAFSGSAGNLVLQALSSQPTTAHEAQAIRQLLDRLESERPQGQSDEGQGDERPAAADTHGSAPSTHHDRNLDR